MTHATYRSIHIDPSQIGHLQALLKSLTEPKPVPYAQLRDEVNRSYYGRHVNTRIKMRQALFELGELIPEPRSTLEITPEVIEAFARRPGRASTTNGLLGSLRIALKYAEKVGYLRPGTFAECRFHITDRDPARQKHHSFANVGRVLAHLESKAIDWPGKRLWAFATILAYCGLRPGEALRLRVEDFEDGFLFVRPNGMELKTPGSQAPVPVPEKAIPILETWRGECGSAWMLPTQRRNRPWIYAPTHARPGVLLREAAEEIGVKGFTPYSLRHSLMTHLMGRLGLSGKQVQMMLRHSNQYAQKFYIHADLANLRDMVRGFDYSPA